MTNPTEAYKFFELKVNLQLIQLHPENTLRTDDLFINRPIDPLIPLTEPQLRPISDQSVGRLVSEFPNHAFYRILYPITPVL